MSAPHIVIAYRGLGESPLEETVLRQTGARVTYVDTLDAPEVRGADALLVTIQPVTAAVIGTLARCKIISRVGVGLDNIDLPAATARGIWVTNVPDYAIDEVSMHAIALMLAQMRRIPAYAAATRAGCWDGSAASTLRRPGLTTLGILGFGRIGRAVAAKARGLGLRVLAHDPQIPAATIVAAGVEPLGWEELLRAADYLSLHLPLAPGRPPLIDGAALALLSPHAYLINTARGGLIDEDALLAARRGGPRCSHDRAARAGSPFAGRSARDRHPTHRLGLGGGERGRANEGGGRGGAGAARRAPPQPRERDRHRRSIALIAAARAR